MRRISIDTLRYKSPHTRMPFEVARRSRWYRYQCRLLIAILFLLGLFVWLRCNIREVEISINSFRYLKDESLRDIMNTTLGFQKILVLNLPSRTDRRDAMSLSAALANIEIEFVQGVTGESIHEKALPPPEENVKLPSGIKGSWRTHINALRRVVEQNLTTAFILEDDVDWDVRVRQGLQRFALASRVLSRIPETAAITSIQKGKIEHRANTETAQTAFQIIDTQQIPQTLFSLPLSSVVSEASNPSLQGTITSPYGDPSAWDILWLGHCGAGMPRPLHNSSSSMNLPFATASNLILTSLNDDTVPIPQHLKAHPFQDRPDALATAFPPHTRIYHRSTGGQLCTVGYAVSQRGARRLLHQFGVKGWNGIFDAELGRWCAGYDPDMGAQYPKNHHVRRKGPEMKDRVCLTTQPPLFAHHHPMKGESDIGGLGGGYARKYETKYLRYSVRMNLERLVEGKGEEELVDQWPDSQPRRR